MENLWCLDRISHAEYQMLVYSELESFEYYKSQLGDKTVDFFKESREYYLKIINLYHL
jgi:hypothetical protein